MLLSTYDAATDFSTTVNPSGAWTYGVRFSEFADFVPYPVVSALDFSPGVVGWNENSGSPPYVGINTTGSEVDSEGIDLPTGVLAMHPGSNGEYSDLRFTAPTTGDLAINFDFKGIDTAGTTTDVHVLLNGVAIGLDDQIAGANQDFSESNYTLSNVAAGSIVDFVVGYGSNGNNVDDCTSLSAQITTNPSSTAEDHLVFTKVPATADSDTPFNVQVKVEDPHNRVVTDVVGGVTLEPNAQNIPGAAVSYAVSPLVKGVANFTGANALAIQTAGTYTLSAVPGKYEISALSGVTGAVSTPIKILEPHLIFSQSPKTADIDEPLKFAIKLLNSKNKSAYSLGQAVDTVHIDVFELDDPNGGYISEHTLIGGNYNADDPSQDPALITVPTQGVYMVEAYAFASNEDADYPTTAVVTSKTFKVLGPHLAITVPPRTTAVNTLIPLRIVLHDGENKPVVLSTNEGSSLSIELIPVSSTGTPETITGSFITGVYDDRSSDEIIPIETPTPGTYEIMAEEVDINGVAVPGIPNVTSKVFLVKA